MIPIDQVLGFLEWFSQQNPYIVWTFDGTVLTFFGLAIIGLIRGEKKEK